MFADKVRMPSDVEVVTGVLRWPSTQSIGFTYARPKPSVTLKDTLGCVGRTTPTRSNALRRAPRSLEGKCAPDDGKYRGLGNEKIGRDHRKAIAIPTNQAHCVLIVVATSVIHWRRALKNRSRLGVLTTLNQTKAIIRWQPAIPFQPSGPVCECPGASRGPEEAETQHKDRLSRREC